jgi:hypothetical protein
MSRQYSGRRPLAFAYGVILWELHARRVWYPVTCMSVFQNLKLLGSLCDNLGSDSQLLTESRKCGSLDVCANWGCVCVSKWFGMGRSTSLVWTVVFYNWQENCWLAERLADCPDFCTMWDLRLSQRWLRRALSSGIFLRVFHWKTTDVSEEDISSIFRVE